MSHAHFFVQINMCLCSHTLHILNSQHTALHTLLYPTHFTCYMQTCIPVKWGKTFVFGAICNQVKNEVFEEQYTKGLTKIKFLSSHYPSSWLGSN